MRLLVVEDEHKLAKSLKTILESEHYSVDLKYDGENGLEQALTEDYDCILLDINLPRIDGLSVCQKIREDGIQTPVLMLTARDGVEDKVKGLNVGADDYLIKPFAVEELLARIRALLRRESTNKEPILSVETLKLDPVSRTTTRSGKVLNLSAKEYALLEFLLRHKGQIVSKEQLLDHVWGNEVDVFSNIVDVYIGYLRKKVDKAFKEAPLIKTFKGMGYRIG